jgi:hypothetical protein
MMVIFLVGLVSMILMRTLRKDYARYSKDDDLDDMVGYLVFQPDIKKGRAENGTVGKRQGAAPFWKWKVHSHS